MCGYSITSSAHSGIEGGRTIPSIPESMLSCLDFAPKLLVFLSISYRVVVTEALEGATVIHINRLAHHADFQTRILGCVEKLMTPWRRNFICLIQILSVSAALAQTANTPAAHSGKITGYTIDGFSLGAQVDFESPMYRGYKCTPSEQFPDLTRCQRTKKEEPIWRRSFDSTSSLMHTRNGTVVYINRHMAPLIFDRNEYQNEINKLSSRFRERAHEMRMPEREGFPNAVIALWGKIQLDQLDPDAISMLASGQSPRKGLLVDYLGDLKRSAQLGLPIFSLSGGAGYLWSASVDRNQRGHFRFLAIDASAFNPPSQPQQSEIIATENKTIEKVKPNAQIAPVESEQAENEVEKPTASKAITVASAELEKVITPETANVVADQVGKIAAEGANLDTLIARLEADLASAEARSRQMETLLYRVIAGLIIAVLIFATLLLLSRRRARAKSGVVDTSEIKPASPSQPESTQAHTPESSIEQKESSCAIVVENDRNKEGLRSAAANARHCIHCTRKISMHDKFCKYCGAAVAIKDLDGSARFCSSCGSEISASDRFCRHCGASTIAVVALPSMNFSNDSDNEVKGVQAPRKRTARKKAVRRQATSSQSVDRDLNERTDLMGDPPATELPAFGSIGGAGENGVRDG
jgi:Double zinc ribbon